MQYRFIGILLLLLVLLTIGALAGVYAALWVTLSTYGLARDPLAVAEFATVGVMVTFEMLVIASLVVWLGVRLTHTVAGPMVRITAVLEQMARGDYDVHVRLRKGDALIDVANAINTLAASLRAHAP